MQQVKLKQAFNSIFFRLFITFVLIITPILLTSTVIFFWGQDAIEREIRNSAISQTKYIINGFES